MAAPISPHLPWKNLKFIAEFFLSISFLEKKRRKATSACIIFNYAVGLLEIVIAFETTRTTGALLVGTRQNILKVPKEESDLAGSSRELLHRSFVVSKSRESYNEEIFASSVTEAPRAFN